MPLVLSLFCEISEPQAFFVGVVEIGQLDHIVHAEKDEHHNHRRVKHEGSQQQDGTKDAPGENQVTLQAEPGHAARADNACRNGSADGFDGKYVEYLDGKTPEVESVLYSQIMK